MTTKNNNYNNQKKLSTHVSYTVGLSSYFVYITVDSLEDVQTRPSQVGITP